MALQSIAAVEQVDVRALGLEQRDLFDDSTRQTPTPTKASAKKASTPKVEKKAGKAYATADEAREAYKRTLGTPSTSWDYELDGSLVGRVFRWDRTGGKQIRPISLHADGWRLEHMTTPRPLFKLSELPAPGSRAYVAEGEKCVDALAFLGLLATTSAGG